MAEAESQVGHVRQLGQLALQANKAHQQALRDYIEKLERELKFVEQLIVCRYLCLLSRSTDNDYHRTVLTREMKRRSLAWTSEASSTYQVLSGW